MNEERQSIFWWTTEQVDPGEQLRGHVRTDVCVVGGGFTGLWTAYLIKRAEPSLEVTVIEREWAGSGASGRCNGYATSLLDLSLHHLVERHGPDRAGPVRGAVARSVTEIGEFCAEHGVDAGYEQNGFATVAVNEGQLHRIERDLRAAERIGAEDDYTFLEGAAAQEVIGSPAIRGILKDAGGAMLNPHRLARGLVRVVRRLGVRVFEYSPATEVVPGRVSTSCGTVTAPHIVVATNAHQWSMPQFRNRIVPIWSYAMVSEPMTPDRLSEVSWPRRELFKDMRNFLTMGRLVPGQGGADERVLWAGRLAPYFYANSMSPRHMRNERVFRELRDAWRRFFPQWSTVRFTHRYGGCEAVGTHLLPYVGSLGTGIHYAYGFSGHGVAPSHTAAKALRDFVLERDSEYTELIFVGQREARLPPEPLRFLATRLTTWLLQRQDRRMDAGHDVGHKDPALLRVINRFA